jgi:hypothetical protein
MEKQQNTEIKTFDAEFLIARADKAQSVKDSWNTKYKEVLDYVCPGHGHTDNKEDKNSKNFLEAGEKLYTSAGEDGVDEFGATMQGLMTPPEENWIALESGILYRYKTSESFNKGDLDNKLEVISKFANEAKNISNFDESIVQFFRDLAVGTACMLVLKDQVQNTINFKTIPFHQYSIEEGENGRVSKVFRVFKIKKESVGATWKELQGAYAFEDDDDRTKEIEFLECTYHDYDENVYKYVVIDKDEKKIMLKKVFKTNPFVVVRIGKQTGEIYGRGVAMKALTDIKVLNKIMEYSLRAFSFNIPTFVADNGAEFDYSDFILEPGAVNFVDDVDRIKDLKVGTDKNLETYQIEQRELKIKKKMLADTLPEIAQGRTATEVIKIDKDLKKRLTSIYGTLKTELNSPLVIRILDVLDEMGLLKILMADFNIMDVDNFKYAVKINSVLSRQLKAENLENVANVVGYLSSIDPSGKTLQSTIHVNETALYMAENGGMPQHLVRTEVEQKVEQDNQVNAEELMKNEELANKLAMKQSV